MSEILEFHMQLETMQAAHGHGLRYSEQYDAYYCEHCDIWLEEVCGSDEGCNCTGRPEKPSMTSGT